MTRACLHLLPALALALTTTSVAFASDEPDELVAGKVAVVRPAELAKFVAKGSFDLPDLPANDPSVEGGSIRFFDTDSPSAGDVTFTLSDANWAGINGGTGGWKYKGAGTPGDPCKVVIVKPTVIKAVCKGADVTLTPPLTGNLGVVLKVGTDTKTYCASYPGIKNEDGLFKGKDALAPASCPTTSTTSTTTTTTSTTSTTTTTTLPTGPCPIDPGIYALTQLAGGQLKVDGFQPFDFPAGGSIIQHVSAGDVDCVHDVVVPFPGGFGAPTFCIAALGFSVQVVQTGCGIGKIDSDGGSDFTITETGDTSDASVCNNATACTNGLDSKVRVDLQVGDGAIDTCASGGTANALLSIPVHTTTWLNASGCPDPDGMPGGPGDIPIVDFPQTLDFTTDTNSADWADIDGNGCCIAGAGPATCKGSSGLTGSGVCADFSTLTITTAASGPIGSTGGPLFDLTFTTVLPNTIANLPGPPTATCANPPAITFGGSLTRCVQ